MSQATRTTYDVEPFLHTVSHYDSPADVLKDARLSTDEKRVALSSWASDMYAVESRPDLREVPGIPQRLRLDDILAALKRLDDDIVASDEHRSASSTGTHRLGGIGRYKPRAPQAICVGPARQM